MERVKKLFGIFSKDYEEYMRKTNHTNVQFEILDKFLSKIKGDVLDIATGPGTIARYIEEKTDCKIYALDYCFEMIEQAKKNSKNIIFNVGDVEDLPYPDNSFDVVTCSYGFYWFKDIERVIFEIKRVLKPNGKLIVLEEEFNEGDPKPRFSKYEESYLKELADLENYFGVRYLKEKLESFDFKLVDELKVPVDEFHSTVGMIFEL